jgi:two-component system, NtrC family, response regulator GlrR
VCAGENRVLDRQLREAVRAATAQAGQCGNGLSIVLLDDDSRDDVPDVALEVFDADSVDAVLAVTAARLQSQPRRRTLAVIRGLGAAQLAALQQAGVDDFVRTPLSGEELLARIQRLAPPRPEPDTAGNENPAALRDLLGQNRDFQRLLRRLPQVARFDVGALLLGETGTGKEALAQAIHYLSPRAQGPWVAVNCAAIPNELLEAELFGHVKGAYTHASQSRRGLIHEAQGGTLFLDEIDSLPYGAQAKLLRFLQDKQYRPVGSNQLVTADVRVVAASNRELDTMVAQGSFRQDLLFRLNVLQLRLPPLRERMEDVPLLACHFLGAAARTWRLPARTLSPAAVQALQGHTWPGNVRELKNVIERGVLMSGAERLEAADIDLVPACGAEAGVDESFCQAKARVVASFERNYIHQLLATHSGNVTQAARAAKKNRRAFFELMRKHHIEPQPYRGTVAAAGFA